MRTTLTIDPDVLEAARAIAAARGETIGQVLSALARRGLAAELPSGDASGATRQGVPLFPVRAGAATVTPDVVRRLLDETPG